MDPDFNDFKDITIRASGTDEEGLRITIDTEEKDSTVITTNLILALCAMYQIPENYLPELFNVFVQVLMNAKNDAESRRNFDHPEPLR
ncbi:hypothetical protein [uncultured Dialister sp.]|uniref:hypothetical protein n=1 Tax=uncultured Dialister sp. TaxID=278064 RepID=UPI0025D27C89|nr:hypothetical protein [uncultured Dialister sp.]